MPKRRHNINGPQRSQSLKSDVKSYAKTSHKIDTSELLDYFQHAWGIEPVLL